MFLAHVCRFGTRLEVGRDRVTHVQSSFGTPHTLSNFAQTWSGLVPVSGPQQCVADLEVLLTFCCVATTGIQP